MRGDSGRQAPPQLQAREAREGGQVVEPGGVLALAEGQAEQPCARGE